MARLDDLTDEELAAMSDEELAHLVVAHRLMRLVPFPAAAATDASER
jgi:hypothetical protein